MIRLSLRFLPLLGVALLLLAAPARAQSTTTLPSGQVGVAYTPYALTFAEPPPTGTVYSILSTGPGETGLPSGMSINASTGYISGTPQVDGVFTGRISVVIGAETNNFPFTLTIGAALGAPEISSSSSALGAVGEDFTYLLSATNSPTSYNVGALPAGLIYASGAITGTPTTAGTYQVSVSANNNGGAGPAITLTITINPSGPVPAITSSSTFSIPVDTQVTYQIEATESPTSYAASGLPVGFSIDTSTGAITGTASVGGVFTSTLTASNGNGASTNFTLTFVVGEVAIVNSASTLSGYTGVAITPYLITATNSPTSFNVGALPNGLSYNSGTRQITGTPTAAATTSVTLSANNALGQGLPFTLSIQIVAPTAPQITTQPASQTKTAGESVTFSVVATGAPAPTYQWKKGTSDILNATGSSYTINAVSAGDAADYTVVVTNAGGSVTSSAATLTVNPAGYSAWRTTEFTSGEAADDAISGFTADPDADGRTNLLEYALGTSPKAGNSADNPVVTANSTEWIFTYTRPADRTDVTYNVQYTTDLTTWTTTSAPTRTATGTTETWEVRVPRSTGANLFFRLKVDRITP
jgi:hypothetical protein